jgi:hypothetical protein
LADSGRHLAGNELRDELNDRLAWDPLNWELRLERVWLDLAFSTNAQRSLAEAREVTRLNPRQPQIPLRFARHYAPRQPPLAREFLHATERTNAALLREVLLLSWQLAPDTSQLWSLTPVSREGLTTLASFGLEQQLYPLAAQASLMLTNFEYPETVAEKLLAARRPDLALGQLTRAGQTWGADYLACRAQFELGRWSEAIRLFERMKARSRFRDPGAPPGQGDVVASLKRAWEQQPGDLLAAQALAQALGARPPAQRDMVLLRQLAQFFPNDFAILWVLFTTQRDTGLERDAAETAVRLAGYLAGR